MPFVCITLQLIFSDELQDRQPRLNRLPSCCVSCGRKHLLCVSV